MCWYVDSSSLSRGGEASSGVQVAPPQAFMLYLSLLHLLILIPLLSIFTYYLSLYVCCFYGAGVGAGAGSAADRSAHSSSGVI